jgi:hypothetical protein
MLFSLLADSELKFSMTLRVDPLDDMEAASAFGELEEKFNDKAVGALSGLTLNPEAARQSAETCKNLKVAIQNGDESGVRVGLVITVYADSVDQLDDFDSVTTGYPCNEFGGSIFLHTLHLDVDTVDVCQRLCVRSLDVDYVTDDLRRCGLPPRRLLLECIRDSTWLPEVFRC